MNVEARFGKAQIDFFTEKRFRAASSQFMATHPGPHVHTHARNEFYAEYQREADDHDREFLKKYEDDLNTSLIFVSIYQV